MSPEQKQRLVKEARKLRRTRMDFAETGTCLYDTLAMLLVAKRQGLYLSPQAGSAYWKAIPEHLDDGVSPNWFGYTWEPNSLMTRSLIAQNMLPEMHVWLGDPAKQEIIDVTSGQFPAQGKRMIGIEWTEVLPPDFLWVSASAMPPTTSYEPDRGATELAMGFMVKAARKYGLFEELIGP